MLFDFCPKCLAAYPRLELLTTTASIDCWRCESCWHVWSVNRETGEPIQHLTPLKIEKTLTAEHRR
jgi:hypothetical protein